jgi:hypothetical protein
MTSNFQEDHIKQILFSFFDLLTGFQFQTAIDATKSVCIFWFAWRYLTLLEIIYFILGAADQPIFALCLWWKGILLALFFRLQSA